MIHNLKLFWKLSILATIIPISIIIMATIALNKTNVLKYEYDNLYGFMLIPLLELDKGNLQREKLAFLLDNLIDHDDITNSEYAELVKEIRDKDKLISQFIAMYESEWLTTLSPEFTAVLHKLGKQDLQTIELNALAQFHQIYASYSIKRDVLLAGKIVEHDNLIADLKLMETPFDQLVKVNRKFADYSNENAQRTISQMRDSLIITGLILCFISMLVTLWLARFITVPINQLTREIQALAEGNLQQTKELDNIVQRKDEIGDIGRTYQELVEYFKAVIKDIVRVSQGLAEGNLRVTPKAEYNGDFSQIKSALQTTLSSLRKVTEDIVQVSQGLAKGENIKTTAQYQGDFSKIQIALQQATIELTNTSIQNQVQNWMKNGQSNLNDKIRGEHNINELAKNIIVFLTNYIDAQVGMFYLSENSTLNMIASYGCIESQEIATQFKIGEGLVGHAALEQKTILRVHKQEKYMAVIQSNLTKTLLHSVIIIPFLYNDELKGVLEIGSAEKFSEIQQAFLETNPSCYL